ncbi:hypothetical protein MLD38_035592 [Melastoma candidum]|uniref:Uncharacterized protein n=1 Tax=Melastoma candidum TaxID=119954 RepID=A0ACB9LI02_9MYRT|nr:hypothetical protein MLD38_035592 [Melastoma candidum]
MTFSSSSPPSPPSPRQSTNINFQHKLPRRLRTLRFSLPLPSLLLRLARAPFSLLRRLASSVLARWFRYVTPWDDMYDLSDSSLIFDLDRQSPPRLMLGGAGGEEDCDDSVAESLYLVPYRWWKETQTGTQEVSGILFTAISSNEFNMQIMLRLRIEDSHIIDEAEESFSGCKLALVSETMWLQALKRNYESGRVNSSGCLSFLENRLHDVFPLRIRLSASQGEKLLKAKLMRIDNTTEDYDKACHIFCTESLPLHIWDFSGQTELLFLGEGTTSANEYSEHQSQEILLELQAHGLSDLVKGRSPLDQRTTLNHSMSDDTFWSSPLRMNGGTDSLIPNYYLSNSGSSQFHYGAVDFLAVKGLKNIGNTCFMNSALQCLAHTPKLVEFFLGDYRKEINLQNPLGMKGELALTFGELLRKIWSPGRGPIYPHRFKLKLQKYASQFSGSNQHDAQEFLAFLLDGLHEDLNRVKQKPYIEIEDAGNRIDEEVAEEYWCTHLARNNSIIVDVCQGQFRSRLVCPICRKTSMTFDPFMYLTLPLPSETTRSMTITIINTDGTTLPSPLAVSVPKSGNLIDLISALKNACRISNNEVLLLAEVFEHRIIRYLEDPDDSLDLIRDDDRIVAYRLPEFCEESILVDFVHKKNERYPFERLPPEYFGIPLVAKIPAMSTGHDTREIFLRLVRPFLKSTSDTSNECEDAVNSSSAFEDIDMEETACEAELDFALEEDKRFERNGSIKINMDEPIRMSNCDKRLRVYVSWPEMLVEKYDNGIVLPEVFKAWFFPKLPQESISLYTCLEAFLKEEPLGPEDMWYCPECKEHRQASKKLDLWRLPEVLVVHLKRFSFSQWQKNKLETFVEFPIDDFDLSSYIANRRPHFSCRYVLYAISNHYGGLGGGHYTAFLRLAGDRWYEFDDERVNPISTESLKTSSAYVLFYRRVV